MEGASSPALAWDSSRAWRQNASLWGFPRETKSGWRKESWVFGALVKNSGESSCLNKEVLQRTGVLQRRWKQNHLFAALHEHRFGTP